MGASKRDNLQFYISYLYHVLKYPQKYEKHMDLVS